MARATATWRMGEDLAARLLALEGRVRTRRFKAGAHIYRQGDVSPFFYFVKSGMVQVSILRADGTQVVLEHMGGSSLCGEAGAFDGLPRFSTAEALETTEAMEFDATRVTDLFVDDPGVALALLRLTSLKQRVLALRLEHLVSQDPEERIMELLHRLGSMFAVDHPRGRKIVSQLTHEQIASMTGVSRVTVTRKLGQLRAAGSIVVEGGQIILTGAR